MKLPWSNVLGLQGIKTIEVDENTIHQIFSKPESNMYFPLPKDKFGNLSQHQVRECVMDELIKFTKSESFQNSFLVKTESVQTNINGKIWSR